MPKRIPNKLPPGAGPRTRGYWSYVFGEQRKPPTGDIYDEDYTEAWLMGYDQARKDEQRRNSTIRQMGKSCLNTLQAKIRK